MDKIVIDVPAMYGDHHVTEVVRLLSELSGVENVNASSSFRVVEVSFDKSKVKAKEIEAKLDEAGYLGELTMPVEIPAIDIQVAEKRPYFRHSEAFEESLEMVSFAQNVAYEGRPLWPCPGIGALKPMDDGR